MIAAELLLLHFGIFGGSITRGFCHRHIALRRMKIREKLKKNVY